MEKEQGSDSLGSLDSSTDNLEMASPTKSVDAYGPVNTNSAYLEVKQQQDPNQQALQPSPATKRRLVRLSTRSVIVVSAIIAIVVIFFSGATAFILSKKHDAGSIGEKAVPTQDISVDQEGQISQSDLFSGREKALFVNGDIITKGSLTVTNSGFMAVLKPETLTANQEYILPNASGTICLNTNNCNFASLDQLNSLQAQLGQIVIPDLPSVPASSLVNSQTGAVSIQGTSNQISVATSAGLIKLSTPQDLGTISSPTFANLILTGNFNLGGVLDLPLNCSINANGGALTTNGSGQVICSDDDTGGGAGTVGSPGGTAGYIPVFTAAQTIADSIISQALGTITIGGNLSASGSITFGGLSNGFLSVNGSGLVSVNTIDLGTDTVGDYVLSVTAGNGLSIGGVSGEGWTPSVSLALQSSKGLEVDGNGLSLIDCANGEILKYNGSNQWACASDADTTGSFTLAGTSGTPETVNNGDTVTIAAGNNVTTTAGATDTVTIATVNNPNFTTSVTTPLLQSSGALSITPGGALTVGSTGQTALLQGTNVTITSNGAGNDIILTSADQIRFSGFDCSALANGGKLTTDASGNISCAADSGAAGSTITGSGTANRIALYTGSQVIADSWLLQNGSTLELDSTRDLSLLGGNFSVTGTGTFSGLLTANGDLTVQTGDTFTVKGDGFTDLTGTGLTISSGSLQTTLGTSVDLTSEVTGVLPVANGGTGTGTTPTNGQLLVGNGSGYSLATITQGAGITITNGAGSITVTNAFGSSVDLGSETTGDYVATITAGNGLTGSASGAGSTPTLALGQLTSDWNQTGAFDIVLNNAGSELRILESSGGTYYGSLDVGDLTDNRTYTLPDATGTICLDTGNCAGSGGGVTTSGGTNNRLAKFNGAQTIADSTISDDGSTVTTSVDLVVQGGSTVIGTTLQDGSLTLYDNGQTALIQASLGSTGRTFTLPDGDGEFCIKELGNCSGGSGGNAPIGAQYLTLSSDGTLTAERVLTFDGTNFSVTDGGANGNYSVNTIQNIATTSTPTFAGLSLNGNLNLGSNTLQGTTAVIDFTNFDVASNGNVTAGTYNGQTISSSSNFTGTLTAAGLLTANGGITFGASQLLTINGDAFNDLTGNGLQVSSNVLTLALQSNKGLEVDGNGLSLIDCANGEILKYNGSNQWACSSDIDTDTGVTTVGAIDSQTKSANGAVISGTSIYLQTADISNPGLVSTGTQTFGGNKTFNNDVEIFGSSINLGNNALDTITAQANLRAVNSATATTGTTTGTGTNTTTLTLTADAFALGDVILIDNAGQDYYTRITADPGSGTYTVSPAVTFENGRTVTKYNVQNVGATATDYSTLSDRFFQGYFLGGVVTGAGSTTLSDGRLHSTNALNMNASSLIVQNTADSTTAFQIQNTAGTSNLFIADTTNTRIGIGATPANGLLTVGTNTTANTGGIWFGTDTNLYRSAANTLYTDDAFFSDFIISAQYGSANMVTLGRTDVGVSGPGITFGSAQDTNIYRSAANTLATDDALTVSGLLTANGNLTLQTGDTFTMNGDAFTDLTGDGLIVSSNALTVDTTSSTGFFRNGGNSFAGSATLGTNDANVLNFETAGTNRFQISSFASMLTGQGNTTIDSSGGYLLLGNNSLTSGVSLGTGNVNANTINIGGAVSATPDAPNLSLQATTNISLGSSGAANTIQIGNTTGAVTQTINIGNNSTASSTNNVNIGSSIAGTTAITGPTTITGRTTGSATALNVNNSTSTGNIFVAQDNGTSVMTIADGGAALLQNSVNSTSAFQVQNASSEQLLNINTSTTPNLLSNPSLEVNTTGWAAKGSATITRDTTQSYVGNASLKIATTATTNDGANYPYSLASSTTYTLSFYAKLDSGSAALSTMILGWSNDGSTDSNCLTNQTVITTGWTRYTCTFTTGTTSGSPYIFIKQSGATARTWYVDSVQLQTGTIGTNIIANPGFEVDTSNWTNYAFAGISRTTSEFNSGVASLQIDSSSTDSGSEGALYYINNLIPNTQYTFRLYAKLGAGMPATAFGLRYHTGSGEAACSGSTPTITSSGWTLWQCSFQSGVAPSSSSYVAFIQTTNLDQVITSYIDDVSVSANIYSPFTLGQMSLNGVVVSPLVLQNSADSRTAFQIQNASGTSNLLVADTINTRIAIGQATASYTLDVAGDINTTSAYKIRGTDICTSSGCTVLATSGIRNQSFTQSSANFNIQSAADGTITAALTARASQTADLLRAQNSSSVKLLSIGADGSITGNAASTATTATTSGTGINTTTVTLSGAAFADNDVILIDNAGQDYYTRIVSGGGTATLTVSPAVTFETGRTVTKYNIQNIGATSTDYTANANRLFQGYFLGGVVAGAGTTTLSDGRLTSTGTMNINSSSLDIRNTADSTTALRVQNTAGTTLLNSDTTNMRISIGSTGTATGQLYVSGTSPTTNLGSITAGDGGGIVKIQGKYAYTIGYNDGQLHVIDISVPASPAIVGSVFAPTNVYGLEVKGKYAYAIDLAEGLVVFDISNPFSPVVAATISVTALGGSGSYDEGFVINGNYLYMVDLGSFPTNFIIIDITNPSNPIVKSIDVPYENGGTMLRAKIQGNYMYAADYGTGQLLIYDLSDPLNPTQVSSTSVSGSLMDIFPAGRYLYAVRDIGTDAIIAYDVSDPSTPTIAGSLGTGNYNPKAVHVQGRYAYVLFGSNRLGIYDISNPASITQVSLLNGGGLSIPYDFEVQGRYAYVANSSNDTFVTYDLGGAYVQQLEAGGIETTTLSVSNDTFIGGDLTLQGGLSVQGNSQFTGNVGVYGQARFQSTTNTTTAFHIQNAGGDQIINVDTTTNNLITNPSFEVSDTVWINGSRSTAERYIGNYSYAVPTYGSSIYALQEVPSLTSNTTYKLTFYIKDGSGDYDTFSSMMAGYNEDGSDVNCMSSQTVSAFGWSRFSCTFTTTTVSNPNPYIYIGQSSSDDRTFYIDGVQLTAISEPTNLVTNPDFESGITDWSTYSTGSVSQSSAQAYEGTYSLRITTGSSTQAGTTHTGYTSYTPNTQYTIKGYARLDSTSAPSQDLYAFGHNIDFGQSATSNVGCSIDSLSSAEWKLFTCTFTTASSLRVSPYITFTRYSGSTTSNIVYLDSVQMYEGPDIGDNNPYFSQAKISLNGVIDSPAVFKGSSNSTTAFIIQGANAGHSLFVADTVNNRIAIGKNSASYTLDVVGTINSTISLITPMVTSASATTLLVDSGTTGALNIGTGANAKTITIGNTTGATAVNIQSGSGGINIGTLSTTTPIQIGNTANAGTQTIGIGNASVASATRNITIGSTSAGTTAIQGATTITNRTTGSADTLIVGNSTSTGSIFLARDNTTAVMTIANGGATTFQNETNSTAGFQIQNAAGTSNLFVADTTNTRIGVGASPANSLLTIGTNTTAATGGVTFGTDTNLYRYAADVLATDGSFFANGGNFFATTAYTGLNFSSATNSGIYNTGADGTGVISIDNGTAGVPVVAIAQGGATTFRNNSNSTTAFQIQNSSASPLLVADTTNLRLYVGDPTPDSTGAILVLDTKNTSGDPTGVDGAMYYNSDSKSFRCYSNSTWRSCGGGVVFANTSLPGGNTVAGTAAETDFASNYTIPANDCQPGRVYKVTARGLWGQDADATVQMKVKMGSTVIGQTNNNNTNASGTETNRMWEVDFNIICQTAGGSGTVEGQGILTAFYNDDITTSLWEMKNTSTVTVDTTTSQTLQMSIDWGTAHANNTFTLRQFIVEASGP